MAFAVSAWFDVNTENKVRDIWRILHESEVSSRFHTGPYRPHLTLGVYESADVEELVQQLGRYTQQRTAFPISLSSLGIFCGMPGDDSRVPRTLFLGVTVTRLLQELHADVHLLLGRLGSEPRPYYLPECWNPHCSLAVDLEATELVRAVDICQTTTLPICGQVDRIGIIDTPAEVELGCCSFRRSED